MKWPRWLKAATGSLTGVDGAGRQLLDARFRGQKGEPPERGTKEFLEIYESSPYVRAIAGKVAGEIGMTRWGLSRLDSEAEIPRTHPLAVLLNRPNPYLGKSAVWRVTQLSLDLVGDAFLLKQRNGLGGPAGLWPVPPHWIVETPTPGSPTYRVSYRAWQAVVPDTEILWLHDAAPSDPYRRGSGIIRALGDEIETDEYSAKHAKQLFFNRATPEFVVMDDGAGDSEIARHERAWNQKLQGFWRSMQPYFTNRELKFFQPQSMNLEHLTLVPLRKHERDIQLQCWGMPPEQLGIIENSNRATIEASDFVYQSRLIQPRRDFLAEELTLKLAPEFDERIQVGFTSTIPADKEYRLNVMKAAPWAFSQDEWRETAGAEPLADGAGEVYMVPMNSFVTDDLTDAEQRPAAAGPPAPGDEKPADEKPADAPPKAGDVHVQLGDMHPTITNVLPRAEPATVINHISVPEPKPVGPRKYRMVRGTKGELVEMIEEAG